MPVETRSTERRHAFYPPDKDLSAIPPLYSTEHIPVKDKIVHLHYFTGDSDWWITELDPATMLAFGYVRLHADDLHAEWGYIDLTELEAIFLPGRIDSNGSGPLRLSAPLIVERDLNWTPRAIPEVLTCR